MNGEEEKKKSPFYQGVSREGQSYTKPPVSPHELLKQAQAFIQTERRKLEAKRLLEQARAFPTAYPEISGAEVKPAFQEVLRWYRKIEPSEKFRRMPSQQQTEFRAKFFHDIVKPLLKEEEIEHYASYFRSDFADSFVHGFVSPFLAYSDRFKLPPHLKPIQEVPETVGGVGAALAIYYMAGKGVSGLGTVGKVTSAAKELELLRKVPHFLKASTPGAHMARTTLQFLVAETPKIAEGKIDVGDIAETALTGAAFGFPKIAPITVFGTTAALHGPEEAVKMTSLLAAMHAVGAFPRAVNRAKQKAANKMALKAELEKYQEVIGDLKTLEGPDLPTAEKISEQLAKAREKRAREAVRKIDADFANAASTAKRLKVAADGLNRLGKLRNEIKELAETGPEVAFEERLGQFFDELEVQNSHLQMKFSRTLEDSEVRITPTAKQAIADHPKTPSSDILQILEDRPLRVNNDIYRTLDDRPTGPRGVSELDIYMADQAVGRGKPISLEQLQEFRIAPEDMASVIRAGRERNYFHIEPVKVAEPPVREMTIESIYLERVSYLPRELGGKYIKEAKDIAARSADLPLKTQRKLWLDFDTRLQTAITKHWSQFMEEKKLDLKEEMELVQKGEIDISEAKAFGIPQATYVKYQRLVKEWQRRLSEGEEFDIVMDEVLASKLPLELLPEELRVWPRTPEDHARAMSRARVEADKYEQELDAVAKGEPLGPEEMAAAADAGILPREVKAHFSFEGFLEPTPPIRKPARYKFEVAIPGALEGYKRPGRMSSLQLVVDADLNIKEVNVVHHRRYRPSADKDIEVFTGADVVQKLWREESGHQRGTPQKTRATIEEMLKDPGEYLTPETFEPPKPTVELPDGTDLVALISLLERKNVRVKWDSRTRRLTKEGKPITLEELQNLPDSGDATSKGETVITMQGDEHVSILKKGDKWTVEEKPTTKKRRKVLPRSAEDLLDLMMVQGFVIERRTPTGGWRMWDLYDLKWKEFTNEQIEQMLEKPRKIPDFTPGIEMKVVPETFGHPGKPPTDQPLRTAAKMFMKFAMPRKQRFDMYQHLYKVPAATAVFDSKTGAERAVMNIRKWYREAAVRAQNIVKSVKPTRQWEVMEYVFTPDEPLMKAKTASKLQLSSQERVAAKEIENLSREVFGEHYRDLFDQTHDYLATGEAAPEIGAWTKRYGWRPEYRFDMRNFLRNLLATRARKAWTPYSENLTQMMKDVENRQDLTTSTKRKIQADIRMYRDRAIAGLMGDHQVTSEVVKTINKHLGLNLEGTVLDKLIGEYLLLTYTSTMPLRLGLVLRNSFQPSLTTGLYVGPKYLAEGYRRAVTKEGKELYAEMNPRDRAIVAFQEHIAGGAPLEEVPGHRRPKKMRARVARGAVRLAGKAERATRMVYEGGMMPYLGADKINVAVSVNAGYAAMKDLAPKMLAGEMTYREFMVRSGLVYMDRAAQMEIKAPLMEGDWKAAGKRYGYHLAEGTQWIYRAANAPWLFEKMGRWGRLAGQFGVWPASYVQFVKRGLFTGDTTASAQFLTRWAVANLGMYLVGKEVFGVDLRMWIATGPLTYAGGPFVQLGQAASELASATFRAEWQKDVAEREMTEAALTMIPLRSMYRDWSRALSEEAPDEALKRLLGLRTLPPPRRRRR